MVGPVTTAASELKPPSSNFIQSPSVTADKPWRFWLGNGCLLLSPTRKSVCSVESRASVFTLMDGQRVLLLPDAIFGCNCTAAVTFWDFFPSSFEASVSNTSRYWPSLSFGLSSRLLNRSASHVSQTSRPADGEIEQFQMVIWMTLDPLELLFFHRKDNADLPSVWLKPF